MKPNRREFITLAGTAGTGMMTVAAIARTNPGIGECFHSRDYQLLLDTLGQYHMTNDYRIPDATWSQLHPLLTLRASADSPLLTGRYSAKERVVGKMKGGFTSKIAAICDSKMQVHECRIDPGNDSDHKVAQRIRLPGKEKKLVGDK